jgi:hypothetical protein
VADVGGFAALYRDHPVPTIRKADGVVGAGRQPPMVLMKMIGYQITLQQVFKPGKPVDISFLPAQQRIMVRRTSQFDKNFARAFVEVPVGAEFDHAETLARIQGPVLFLNAQYFMRDGRLLGALTDDAVERVKGLVKGRGSMSGWTVDMVFRWKLRKRRRRRSRLGFESRDSDTE